METSTPSPPTTRLSTALYHQLVYTLTDLLPPPLDDSPSALRARNHAAIAKVAALLPVNANELDLAAHCIAARAQAEDLLRLLRQNAGDIHLVMRLNAQYASMVRTSLSVHARLMRAQAGRQKREATDGAATQDAWTRHVAEQSMLKVADPDIARLTAAAPKTPKPGPVTPPPPEEKQSTAGDVSETNMNSHDMAFETWLNEQPWNQEPDPTGLRQRLREAMAAPHLAGQRYPASACEPSGTPG